MKKKLIIWGVILLTAINVAALTTSAYNHWDRNDSSRREHRREGRRSSWEERLGLSASQSEQMKVQHEVLVEKIRPLRDVMQGKRDHFYELVMSGRNGFTPGGYQASGYRQHAGAKGDFDAGTAESVF